MCSYRSLLSPFELSLLASQKSSKFKPIFPVDEIDKSRALVYEMAYDFLVKPSGLSLDPGLNTE